MSSRLPHRKPGSTATTNALAALVFGLVMVASDASAQNVEFFVGHERATEDVMFFKFFERPGDSPQVSRSDLLFFFRARASAVYGDEDGTPQFGLTSAISWNPPALGGLAPVLVGQALSKGLFAKAGIQYARVTRQWTVFSWVVSSLQEGPSVDVFALGRYVHPLGEVLGLFVQAEALATFPTRTDEPLSFTERVRLGLKVHRLQFGPGLDVGHTGRGDFNHTFNAGGFARVEF
jgi:hypothetical protein